MNSITGAVNNADNRTWLGSIGHAVVWMREKALGMCALRSIQRRHLFDFSMDFMP